jgi:hypothetical protein
MVYALPRENHLTPKMKKGENRGHLLALLEEANFPPLLLMK